MAYLPPMAENAVPSLIEMFPSSSVLSSAQADRHCQGFLLAKMMGKAMLVKIYAPPRTAQTSALAMTI